MPTVKFFGNLRDQAQTSQQTITGQTVREVLATLCAGNKALCASLFDGDQLWPHVRVMINGRGIEFAQGLDTPLADTDQLAIFPPIAGG